MKFAVTITTIIDTDDYNVPHPTTQTDYALYYIDHAMDIAHDIVRGDTDWPTFGDDRPYVNVSALRVP